MIKTVAFASALIVTTAAPPLLQTRPHWWCAVPKPETSNTC
jgi:hypothetical protein